MDFCGGRRRSPCIGFLLVVLSAAAFGTPAIFARYAYADGVDPFTLLFLRFSLASLLMLMLAALRRERLPRGETLLRLIGMGALGYVGQSFCYFTALRHASAGVVAFLAGLERIGPTNAAMLSTLEPVVTISPAALFLGEALRPPALPGGGPILAAVVVLARGELRREPATADGRLNARLTREAGRTRSPRHAGTGAESRQDLIMEVPRCRRS